MGKKERCFSKVSKGLLISLLFIAISSGIAFAQTVILNQPPDQLGYNGADPAIPETLAENFILTSPAVITQIRIWGVYIGTNPIDNFSVIFHSDAAGRPGTAISTENNVPVSRNTTGLLVFGLTEYVYTLTLSSPVSLTPGTYWVEIYNSPGPDATFFWESGTLDGVNGISGSAGSHTVPAGTWYSDSGDLAIIINPQPAAAIPTMNEWGMIIFMVLAGFIAIVYIRRINRAVN